MYNGLNCLERVIVFIDLETTSLNVDEAQIVQFSLTKYFPDDGSVERMGNLVRPTIAIPPEATKVHGITNRMVKDKMLFIYYVDAILEFINYNAVAGYNITNYDIPILINEVKRCAKNGDHLAGLDMLDAMVIFKKKNPRTLAAAYQYYCAKKLENAHDAETDVKATMEVLNRQVIEYPELRNVSAITDYCRSHRGKFRSL